MTDNDNPKLNGVFHSYMTPSGYTQRAEATRTVCDLNVPPAAGSIIGQCEYYYRPLHCAYLDTVEKVSVSSVSTAAAYTAVKVFARTFNPWTDIKATERLLNRREQLIPPHCTDSDWSRHSNFMMRHIGCGHKPPSYYVAYGYYYCSNYGAKLRPRLSRAGQEWLDNARWYLQKYMEEGLQQNVRRDTIELSSETSGHGGCKMDVQRLQLELDEDTFKQFAFKTHPLAYLDGGLAKLPLDDLFRIMGGPNLQEWADPATYKQAWDSGKVVGQRWAGQARDAWSATKDDLDDPVSRAVSRLMESK
jgi:hypothetical protein